MPDVDVEVEGDPSCAHSWRIEYTPDDLLYICKRCGREVWGA